MAGAALKTTNAKIAKTEMRIEISLLIERPGISASKQTNPVDPGQINFGRARQRVS
jgi:hypothetical protein